MSKNNFDLPKHAADKVERALKDVLQLTDDPGEMLRIYVLAAGVCLGGAGGTLAAMLRQDGHAVSQKEANAYVLDLVRKVVTDGAEAAWKSLQERAPK